MNVNNDSNRVSSSYTEVNLISKKTHRGKEKKPSNDEQKSKISSIQKDALPNQTHEKSVDLGKRSKIKNHVSKQSKENGHRLENKARREESLRIEDKLRREASDDVQLLKLLELDKTAILAINELQNLKDLRLADIVRHIIYQDSDCCCALIESIHEAILPIDHEYLVELAEKNGLKKVEDALWDHQKNYPYATKATVSRRTNAVINNKITKEKFNKK